MSREAGRGEARQEWSPSWSSDGDNIDRGFLIETISFSHVVRSRQLGKNKNENT